MGLVQVWGLAARAEERCPGAGRGSNDVVFFGAEGRELFVLRRDRALLCKALPSGKWGERTCPAGKFLLIAPAPRRGTAFCYLSGIRGEYLGLVSLTGPSPIWLRRL